MIETILPYIGIFFFGIIGIYGLTHGLTGKLFYHKKVEAKARNGRANERHINSRQGVINSFRNHPEDYDIEKASFIYEEDGKKHYAKAVNLLERENLWLEKGKTYTIKVSSKNPEKCYFPINQIYLYKKFNEKLYIFVYRTGTFLGFIMFIGFAIGIIYYKVRMRKMAYLN